MRLIAISALMLQNQQATAKAPLQEFIAYYKGNKNALRRDWEYAGTQHYIANHKIDATSRQLMLSLIELLQLEPKVGIDAIEKLVPNLPNPHPAGDSALTQPPEPHRIYLDKSWSFTISVNILRT